MGAIGDDVVEELVEAEDAAVLAFDAAEFHEVIIVVVRGRTLTLPSPGVPGEGENSGEDYG